MFEGNQSNIGMVIDGSNVDGGFPIADSAGFNWGDLFSGGTSGGEMGGGSMLGGVMDMALSLFGGGGAGKSTGKKKGDSGASAEDPEDLDFSNIRVPQPMGGGAELNLPMNFSPFMRPQLPKPDVTPWIQQGQQFATVPQIRWQ